MVVSVGWRGSSGSIPVQPHGSGGMYGANLSTQAGSGGVDPATGNPVVTNTAGLPVRSYPVDPQMRPGNVPGNVVGVPGRPNSFAYGNPGAHTQDARAGSGGSPVWGSGEPSGSGSPGGRQDGMQSKVSALGVGQETAWRGADKAGVNDKLWATDRHGILNTGTERGGGRDSGQTDPVMDGPPRPSLRILQRTINWQQGNPLRFQDEFPGENRGYSASAPASVGYVQPYQKRKLEPGNQYIGEQGTGWSPVYGGVPGLYQPYGSYSGYTADKVKGIQSPAEQGGPGDGPQKVFSGPPHGLHTRTYPDYASTLGYYMAVPQMSLPRIDRPANSTSEGQSYSQTVQPQGQTGTTAVQSGAGGVGAPGTNWRSVSAGWRGSQPGGGNL